MVKEKVFGIVIALSLMVCTSSVVWAASCDNATFDIITGVLHIPVLSIDDKLFSTDLKKQGNSTNYKLMGFFPLEDDALCEIATYDEAVGIIHIPSLELGVLVYSVDLIRKGKSDTFTLDESSMVLVGTIVSEEECEPAAYDTTTGILTIPAVEVEDALFSAILSRRGNSSNFELIFAEDISDKNGDEGGEDTDVEADDNNGDEGEVEDAEDQNECEPATFIPSTGILHLPLIKVGNSYYSADLQPRGESENIYFDVTVLEVLSPPTGEGNDTEEDNGDQGGGES